MTIMPPNSTATELALEAALARISDVPVPNATLWTPETCPVAYLPWLAHSLSVDDWDANWSEARQRAVIAASIAVHRVKGTVWAIRQTLLAQGYGTATLIEAKDLTRLGFGPPVGKGRPLGTGWRLGWRNTAWADYWVEIDQPISPQQVNAMALALRSAAPARCRLRSIRLVAGARYVLGRDIWSLGNTVPLGGVYDYEDVING